MAYHPRVADCGEFVALQGRGYRAWLRADLAAIDLNCLWAPLQPLGGAKGRGGVGRLQLGELDLVVRPYRRGGAMAALLKDRYLSPSRVRDELATLAALRREGVPVVVPVAGVARKRGAFWQLRIATECQPGAMTVPTFLANFPQHRLHCAEAVGTLVRLAFAAGLQHPDLHLDNILCTRRGERVRAVLVDLDRCSLKAPLTQASQDLMLVRMQRHLWRHLQDLPAIPSRSETMCFLRALGLDRPARHAAWRRLAAAAQRQLRRHTWLRQR